LWEKDHKPIPEQLLLGNADSRKNRDLYAKLGDQDALVLVKSDALNQFKKTAFDLRYKKNSLLCLGTDPKNSDRLFGKDFCDRKRWGHLENNSTTKQAWESYKINNLMYDLQHLEFKEEIVMPGEDLGQYGLQEPQVQLTLWKKRGKMS